MGEGATGWRHTKGGPPEAAGALRAAIRAAAERPLAQAALAQVAETWVAEHAGALVAEETEAQRKHGWKRLVRWSGLARAPAEGSWGAKTPSAYVAPPAGGEPLGWEDALDAVVMRHPRAFGPAGAEDVASWTGVRAPEVRAALDRLAPRLHQVEGEDGRALADLPAAPRPSAEAKAPVRFLAAFDSVLLAYARERRARIVPDAHRGAIYEPGNLRIHPTYLVDGFVAGMWSVEVKRGEATLTLRPLERLTRPVLAALEKQGDALLAATQPGAVRRRIVLG